MNNIRAVFTFGWPYLRRYKGRLLTGVLFGILFGLANGSFIWATKTLVERLNPERPAVIEKADKTQDASIPQNLDELVREFQQHQKQLFESTQRNNYS